MPARSAGSLREQPGRVQSDVAGADDDGAEVAQVGRGHGRVAVGPPGQVATGDDPGQVLARDREPSLCGRPHGDEDRVVGGAQLLEAHVTPDLRAQPQRHPRVPEDPPEDAGHPLGRGVVGGHAPRDEPPGHVLALDEREPRLGGPQQPLRGVAGGRAGADDGDAQLAAFRERPREAGRRPRRPHRPVRVERVVALGVVGERGGQLLDRQDGVDRAGIGAGPAVDAGARVDEQRRRCVRSPARRGSGGCSRPGRPTTHEASLQQPGVMTKAHRPRLTSCAARV